MFCYNFFNCFQLFEILMKLNNVRHIALDGALVDQIYKKQNAKKIEKVV